MAARELPHGKPSALTHGLTSRWAMAAADDEIDALVPLLIGSSPHVDAVIAPARSAAEAILHLAQVRAAKRLAADEAITRQPAATHAPDVLAKVLADAKFVKFDEYERRALSRRAKAIRELDLARIEVERRSEDVS